MMTLAEIFEECNGTEPVYNIEEAFYITQEGDLLDGEMCDGIRGNDHRMLLGCLDLESTEEGWNELHNTYNVIRYIPELNIGLYKERQIITDIQKQITEENNIQLELY